MTKDESSIIFLKYTEPEDMLKVILFSSQSALGLTPMLYHVHYKGKKSFIKPGPVEHWFITLDRKGKTK
jgi:hypothetical protein